MDSAATDCSCKAWRPAIFRVPWTSCDRLRGLSPGVAGRCGRAVAAHPRQPDLLAVSAADSFSQVRSKRRAEGDGERLKEYAIGVEVFERGREFDPHIDPIVRVEAARLRSKLLEYYLSEGPDPVVISIPKGSYAAVLQTARRAVMPEHQRASIAVLPFVNMSSKPDNEYFTVGLPEDVINTLTTVPDLQVVARTSVFRFKGQHNGCEGYRRPAQYGNYPGSQLRITPQLTNVEDGFHL